MESAKEYGKKALLYAKSNQTVDIEFKTLSYLSKIETKLGDSKKAIEYYEQLSALQDRYINNALSVADILGKYENQQKELEILNLEIANQEKQKIIDESSFRSRLYLLTSIFALVTILLLLRNFLQNKKSKAQLEALNSSLNTSNENLIKSNKELENFAHMASHDLKSPLRTITSFSSLLQKKAGPKLGNREKEFLNFITISGNSLSLMIDDMLAYSKVGSQNISKSETDMNSMLEDLILSLKGQANGKSVTLNQVSSFPNASLDKVKIKRVFQNIASNAIKFCDKEKENSYVNFSYKELENFHQFTISDNGIGIPDTSKNLFEPFTYLNSKSEYKGTGMGLALSLIHI